MKHLLLEPGRLPGTAPRARSADLAPVYTGLVPPFPGPAVVPLVTVPPPPVLDPAEDLAARARRLARCYAGAVQKKLGVRLWAFLKYDFDPRRSKHFVTLCEGAEALTAARAPPAAWCAFSLDVWARYVAPRMGGAAHRNGPPLAWVLAGARVDERTDWYRAEAHFYQGGRLWLGPLHRQLVVDWNALERDLLGLAEPTRACVESVVRRRFPDGVWDMRVEGARREALEAQAMLTREAQSGSFLW